MLTRRSLRNITGPLAGAFIALSAMVCAAPASAQICGNALAQDEALANVASRGGSWVGAGGAQAPTLRFRIRAGCAEVSAPGWEWMALENSFEVQGSYEGTARRKTPTGLIETVDIRFRFTGGPELAWIEYETWYWSPLNRTNGEYSQGTLFYRP